MTPSFLICKESKIESNTSFYGCFYMGPFEPNQSVTIANSLRRTLLAELYGLAITSVEIEGASHEYSNLKGVNESVLDLLLNLKNLVLKKSCYSLRPVLGYLKVKGPGKVRASDLRLPPFVQCVDPNHLIATLEEDGVLTMKVLIQYGHKWLSPPKHFFGPLEKPNLSNVVNSVPDQKNLERQVEPITDFEAFSKENKKKQKLIQDKKKLKALSQTEQKRIEKQEKEKTNRNSEIEILESLNSLPRQNLTNLLNFHYFKRRFVFNQIKKAGLILSKTYMEILSKQGLRLLNRSIRLQKKTDTLLTRWSAKKRYPGIDLKKTSALSSSFLLSSLRDERSDKSRNDERRDETSLQKTLTLFQKKKVFLRKASKSAIPKPTSKAITIDSIFNPVNKVNFTIEHNDYKTTLARLEHAEEVSKFYKMIRACNSRTYDFFSEISVSALIDKRSPHDYPVGTKLAFSSRNDVENKSRDNTKKNVFHSKMNPVYGSPLKKPTEKQEQLASLNDDKRNALNMFLDYQRELKILKMATPKDNIILEIWTNGSLHPRDALYQSFANLIQVFSKLNEITPFLNVLTHLPKLPPSKKMTKTNKKKWEPVLKQIKSGKIESSLIPSVIPVTTESYLGTYMTPRFRDFRILEKPNLKSNSLKGVFRHEVMTSFSKNEQNLSSEQAKAVKVKKKVTKSITLKRVINTKSGLEQTALEQNPVDDKTEKKTVIMSSNYPLKGKSDEKTETPPSFLSQSDKKVTKKRKQRKESQQLDK